MIDYHILGTKYKETLVMMSDSLMFLVLFNFELELRIKRKYPSFVIFSIVIIVFFILYSEILGSESTENPSVFALDDAQSRPLVQTILIEFHFVKFVN